MGLRGPKVRPVMERILMRTEIVDMGHLTPCWIWGGYTGNGGYGQVLVDSSRRKGNVHRVAYEHIIGPVPKGLLLDHLCRVPACLNPDHLEPVTCRENIRRGIKGVLTTHCPQNHEYTPENTSWQRHARGISRRCKTCHREKERARNGNPN